MTVFGTLQEGTDETIGWCADGNIGSACGSSKCGSPQVMVNNLDSGSYQIHVNAYCSGYGYYELSVTCEDYSVVGIIIGVVVGVVICCVCVAACVFCCRRGRNQQLIQALENQCNKIIKWLCKEFH